MFFSRVPCAVQFCEECVTLLDHDSNYCIGCAHVNDLKELEIVLEKKIEGKKGWLKETAQTERATVRMSCPNCSSKKLYFTTKQLRSADEGESVFYECSKCGHKFVVHN
jgi:DNA-directed RNA polymerase I subunit RPA12